MIAYQLGEEPAFRELYSRYSGRVYAFLTSRVFDKIERDDLFQTIFLKLHKSRHLYNADFLFAPWLFTICRTALLDYFRSKKPNLVSEGGTEIPDIGVTTGSVLVLEDAIKGLPENQRTALQMRYQDGLNFSEIATRLKTSSTNARQLISRALRKLRSNNEKE